MPIIAGILLGFSFVFSLVANKNYEDKKSDPIKYEESAKKFQADRLRDFNLRQK